jgi:hypothetical protein
MALSSLGGIVKYTFFAWSREEGGFFFIFIFFSLELIYESSSSTICPKTCNGTVSGGWQN